MRRVAERSPLADRIRFTGWVGDEDLRFLYGACDLFVFPSFYEGFGLPILEAMACGRAVACSNTSAMPEVANAAAVQFDPHSVHEIARAMQDLLLDHELRTRMERLGLKRAARFHWTRTAGTDAGRLLRCCRRAPSPRCRGREETGVVHPQLIMQSFLSLLATAVVSATAMARAEDPPPRPPAVSAAKPGPRSDPASAKAPAFPADETLT